jgi:hypothetical protein
MSGRARPGGGMSTCLVCKENPGRPMWELLGLPAPVPAYDMDYFCSLACAGVHGYSDVDADSNAVVCRRCDAWCWSNWCWKCRWKATDAGAPDVGVH